MNKEELTETIKDLEYNIKQIKVYLEYGATLGEITREMMYLKENTKYLNKILNKYINEEYEKEIKILESNIY